MLSQFHFSVPSTGLRGKKKRQRQLALEEEEEDKKINTNTLELIKEKLLASIKSINKEM